MRFTTSLLALTIALTAIIIPANSQPAPDYRLLKLNGQPVKWGDAAFGAGMRVTYGFASSDHSFDDALNCQNMGPLDGVLVRNAISQAQLEAVAEQAFDTWSTISNVHFELAASDQAPDILIGADLDNDGWAHADIKIGPAVNSPAAIAPITRGLVCLSPQKSWKIGFGADPNAQDIQYTLTHEIGHIIGLNHTSPRGQVMSFTYGEDYKDLQSGDIAGARALYGPSAMDGATLAALPVSQPN